MKFSFDEWARLAKEDRETFEACRTEILTQVITQASPEFQQKLKGFKALNTDLIDTIYQSPHVRKWNGHRLLAVDGVF